MSEYFTRAFEREMQARKRSITRKANAKSTRQKELTKPAVCFVTTFPAGQRPVLDSSGKLVSQG